MKQMNLFLTLYFTMLFCSLLSINLIYLEGIPHVPDSVAYLFMAKIFASGHLTGNIPIPPKFVDYFPGILTVEGGYWLFQYPFGHPLMLSLGVLIGFPNLIPPLIGTGCIFLLFLIAKNLYGIRNALFVLPLPLISPFFLENSSSFMSHNTAAFYLILSFYFLIQYHKNGKLTPLFFSGIFLGLLFNTRPLTSFPFLFLESSIILIWTKFKKRNFWLFISGFGILFVLYLFYNALTNGNIFQFQYYTQNQGLFNNNLTNLNLFLDERLNNFLVLFDNFGPMLYNIPPMISYVLLLIPFFMRKDNFWDRIFFASLFTLPFIYFFYNGRFLMYGPRFWYELLPFVFLLTARSFSLLSEKKPKSTFFILLLCIIISLSTWYGLLKVEDPDIFSPLSIHKLKGINFIHNAIPVKLASEKITNAVIFIKNCDQNWWCYGSVFAKNSPRLDTDIVYLRDYGNEENLQLKKYYPAKAFYRIDYNSLELNIIN